MSLRLQAHLGTLRQMEILLAVYDSGSVSGAAETLHLTQPTISMQLKKLADVIGFPLYNIVGRKVVFTEAGLEVVKSATEILDSFARLEMSLSDMGELKSGTLRLAVVTTSKYFIPHLLGPFCERYPNVAVQLNVGNRQQIIERLKQGIDDFYVFSHPPADLNTESIEFFNNPLVAIAQENHPLVSQDGVSLAELCEAPFLMRENGSGTRLAIERFMAKQGVKLNVKMTIESNEAIKHSVMSGLGVSILSAHTLAFGGNTGLAQLNVKELPINSNWYFLWLKSKRPSAIAQAFLTHVESEGREMLLTELAKHRL
ncbi:LysR family transcriptional regulator [Shewanella rhizosphaerae]|uniref:LysR family transcriptional regulator n=1 Tax=Shewanella TaxID=22 RepID=UPI00118201C2|nr:MULTISPECIES: LysR family transcriptional regulator [Shewanella]QYJ83615.1 LysR family transcriptional regulator [Shewanella aegiceratis]QYK14125.1 LysR family transcriptional regulator [Shewanella rhizosphaerae]TVP12281.1 LysR family transcriptional regulator [Shewanella sp. KCT]